MLAAAVGISACSTNNVLNLRPDVDIGTTAALPGGGMQDLVPDDPYLQQADGAQQQEAVEEPVAMSDQAPGDLMMSEPADTADMGQAAGSEPDGLGEPVETASAAEMGGPYAMSEAAGTQSPAALEGPSPASGSLQPRPLPEPEGNHGVVLAGYPHMDEPVISGPPPMPADELACRRELKSLGVSFRELEPIHDSASCSIGHPIKVSGLPGGVALKPAATLNCEMALTFAKWTKDELNPAARRRYWSRVKTIHQMSSYSCRRINGSHSMSEHSKGNAIDIGRIELSNGKDIEVEKPGLFAFRTRGFLKSVRTDGCEYFSTVLGPGYNWDHRNHFHFDIKPRRNGRHACH